MLVFTADTLLIIPTRCLAAVSPTLLKGCFTVVIEGTENFARMPSSKAAIEISSGTRRYAIRRCPIEYRCSISSMVPCSLSTST